MACSRGNNGYDGCVCIHQCIYILLLQKQAWSGHKRECKCLQSLLPRLPTDSVRLAARLIFALVCFWTFPLFNSVKLNVHKESCLIPFLLCAITDGHSCPQTNQTLKKSNVMFSQCMKVSRTLSGSNNKYST